MPSTENKICDPGDAIIEIAKTIRLLLFGGDGLKGLPRSKGKNRKGLVTVSGVSKASILD